MAIKSLLELSLFEFKLLELSQICISSKLSSPRSRLSNSLELLKLKMNNKIKTLSNLDIDKIMKNCDNYRGTFSKDVLSKTMNESESTVVNLQDYFADNGTHWVYIYNDENS